jgi:macrolide-specific efflux system membrane fusion protein
MRSQTLLRRLLIGGGVIVVLAIVAFGPMIVGRLAKSTPRPPLATAEPQSFSVVASASGTLLPAALANVSFSTAGQVSAIYVHVGGTVSKGQPLAQLNHTSQDAKLAAAEAAIAAAEQQLAAAQASGSSTQIASARSQVASANVSLVSAQQEEAATRLTAPESGTVLAVNGAIGDGVNAGSSGAPQPGNTSEGFIVIGSATSFVASAAFTQTEDVELAVGQTVTVNVDAIPGLRLPATVTSIDPSATLVNGVPSYYATMTLTSSDKRLRDGQTVTVNVVVATAKNVLAIPTQALFTNATGALQVDVWSGGSVYATTVTIGLVGSALTQITSGLQQGEQVMLTPAGASSSSSPPPSPTT